MDIIRTKNNENVKKKIALIERFAAFTKEQKDFSNIHFFIENGVGKITFSFEERNFVLELNMERRQ